MQDVGGGGEEEEEELVLEWKYTFSLSG